ncbi:antA/AntB antirepressor family protein [Paraburkholderia hospita]|uniref:antA/AntB antirepressor family protein n=1 Tax=Paraburkholderia hospita TaxID=169430 RepID=UPI001ABCFEB9|nr:antA/AntB antirepressor family protein [Paraburkholderia hospita]
MLNIAEREIGPDLIQTVNARELHAFLEVGKDFATWINDRIKQYNFFLDQDFATFPQNGGKGRPTIEYAISLDMAKELSMVERNEKGQQARRYFIACEKRALAAEQKAPAPLTPAEMFLQSAQALVQVERLQAEQAAALVRLEERIDGIDATLTACPSNAEPITKIRDRIYKQYGIPRPIIDRVLNEIPYRPRPAGVVRNHREEAKGATYTVWWTKDVTALFKRFVSECQRATPALVAHPDIDRRFHLQAEQGVLV